MNVMAYVQSSALPTSTFNNGSSQLALNKNLLHKSRQHKNTLSDQKHVSEMHKKMGKMRCHCWYNSGTMIHNRPPQ
ncbi:hypothetical protein NC652_005546 [Populus alba x Populus x berolinensis]|nr:hypothetical protein NC652_005546 [Populus alba x Populus x berolinensis]